ncbi:MAG: aminofutalosine synthase MqnE [Aquificae bacterium]|nr:aminofutalosine synthase MqnE [Aquificota bacterium]
MTVVLPSVDEELIENLLRAAQDKNLIKVAEKVLNGKRLSEEDALNLFQSKELPLIGLLAEYQNRKKNKNYAYFVVNVQINPTNVCIYGCKFCAFAVKGRNHPRAYEMTLEEILEKIRTIYQLGGREVHMVGGIPPHWRYEDYLNLLREIKKHFPDVVLKAYTAIEVYHMMKMSRKSAEEVLLELKEAGLDVLPGGGAEIFNEEKRKIIAPYKAKAEEYLKIHKTAHRLGIPTNITMLYGHIEDYKDRVEHMSKVRKVQDETGGFQVFIPLKYHPEGTALGGELASPVEDLKTIAVARLFLDNFDHIKAYWVTLGEKITQVALNYGADDIDGTILEEKIVHAAGTKAALGHAKEKLINLIKEAGKIPVERDTFYRPLKVYN